MNNSEAFLQKLKTQGLLPEGGEKAETIDDSPWYLKVLMGCCGWLAAAFGLAFLGLAVAELFDSAPALAVFGGVLMAVAFYFLSSSTSEFLEHLGLALSAAGQVLVAFSLFSVSDMTTVFAVTVLLVMQIALVFFMPSYIHRFVSTYFAALCLAVLLDELNMLSFYSLIIMLTVGLIWVDEFRFGQQIKKFQAIGYGLVVAGIQFKTSALFNSHGKTWDVQAFTSFSPWLDEALNLVVLLFVLYLMLDRKLLRLNPSQRHFSLGLLVLLVAMSFFAHGIVFGLMVILLGFASSNRILLSLGLAATLINLSSYYYLLEMSLLHKSLLLSAIGGLSLMLAYVNNKLSSFGD